MLLTSFSFLRLALVFPRLASNFILAKDDPELQILLPKPTSTVLRLRVCVRMPFVVVVLCASGKGTSGFTVVKHTTGCAIALVLVLTILRISCHVCNV